MAIGTSAMEFLQRRPRAYAALDAAPHAPVLKAQCRCCSFEPEDPFLLPLRCPKCHGSSWERFARPGACADFAPAAAVIVEEEAVGVGRRVRA